MVSRTQLIKYSGISNLQKRNVQQNKQVTTQFKAPVINATKPQEVSQADIEAQKKYERDLAEYNSAMKEKSEWEVAEKLVMKGKGYAAKGDAGVYSKVKKIDKYASEMAKYNAMKNPTITAPIATDSLGQGMSIAPELVKTTPNVFKEGVIKYQPVQINKPSVVQEKQRYENLGYSSAQANKLATESVSQGGVTYSPERAKEITKPTLRDVVKNINVFRAGKEYRENAPEINKVQSKISILNRELSGIEQVHGDKETNTINLKGKELEDYNKKYAELEEYIQKAKKLGFTTDAEGNLIQPTVSVGFFGERQEPYSKYRGFAAEGSGKGKDKIITKGVSRVGAGASFLWSSLSATGGEASRDVINVVGGYFDKEKDITGNIILKKGYTDVTPEGIREMYFQPQGTIQYDTLTGEPIIKPYTKEVYMPETVITKKDITSQNVANIVYKGGQGVAYFTPVGTVMLAGEASNLIEEKRYGAAALTGLAIFAPSIIKGGKVIKEGTKAYTKEIPIKDLGKQFKEGRYYERDTGIIRDGKQLINVRGLVESKPMTIQITTTKFREKFPRFFKPLKVESKASEYSILENIEPVERGSKEAIWYKEVSPNKKYVTLYNVGGKSTPTTLEQFNSLSTQEQLQWKRVAERAVKRKLSKEEIPKVLGENINKVNELIVSTKAGRVSIKEGAVELKTPYLEGFKGFKPTIEISTAKSASKTITTPSGQYDISQVFTSYIPKKTIKTTILEQVSGTTPEGLKIFYHGTAKSNLPSIFDIGLKSSEVTGGTAGLSTKNLVSLGTTKVSVKGYAGRSAMKNRWKGIQDSPQVLKVNVNPSKVETGIGKSGIEEYRVLEVPKENIQIVEEELQQISKPIIKTKKYIPQLKELPTQEIFTPLMVGGRGLKTIPYEGTGQYEVQELEATRITNLPMDKTFVEVKPTQENILVIRENVRTQFRQPQIELLKPSLSERELFKVKEITKVKEIPKLKELVRVAERMKQEQLFKQSLKLKQGTTKQTKFKLFTPKTPTTRIPIRLSNKLVKKLGKKEEGEFEAFAFKLGKEVSISKGTKEKVTSELSGFLQTELSASGFLTKGGKKIKAEETGLLGTEFRKSRTKNPYLIVEEKSLRLRKSGTGKQIQAFRF